MLFWKLATEILYGHANRVGQKVGFNLLAHPKYTVIVFLTINTDNWVKLVQRGLKTRLKKDIYAFGSRQKLKKPQRNNYMYHKVPQFSSMWRELNILEPLISHKNMAFVSSYSDFRCRERSL